MESDLSIFYLGIEFIPAITTDEMKIKKII